MSNPSRRNKAPFGVENGLMFSIPHFYAGSPDFSERKTDDKKEGKGKTFVPSAGGSETGGNFNW
jgi:hypothetical protein